MKAGWQTLRSALLTDWMVLKRKRIRQRLLRILGVVGVLVIAFVMNTWDITSQFLGHDEVPQLKQEESPLFDRMLTPLFLRLKAHRDSPSPEVSTIAFGAGDFQYLQDNPCQGRRFMADVVDVLSRLGARVIVIDKYYGEKSCNNRGDNSRFESVLSNSPLRIVIGLHTDAVPDKARGWALTLTPSFQFARTRESSEFNNLEIDHPVVEGLLRLNENLLRIPLQWPVSDSGPEDGSKGRPSEHFVDTLGFAAARLVDPQIVNRESLSQFLANGFSPYGESASLQLNDVSENDILCSDPQPSTGASYREEWGLKCDGIPRPIVRNVVVIGSPAEKDRYDLAGRSLYGYQIFAMYIEELLSARYLSEMHFRVWYSALLAWGVITQAWLVWTDSPWRALAVISIGTAVIVTLLLILLVLWDYFPPMDFIFYIVISLFIMVLLELAEALREESGKAKVKKKGRRSPVRIIHNK